MSDLIYAIDDRLIPTLDYRDLREVCRGRIVPHHTYSLQQSEFGAVGFEVTENPWKVVLPDGARLVCIGTRDRYDIFAGEPVIEQYETVDEWRASREAPVDPA